MLLTLENGLNIDLLFPERIFYRVSNASGYYEDFGTLDEAQAFTKYDFLNYYTVYKVIQTLDDFGKITDTKLFKV